mgnify:CR=1 FL=1
MNFEIAKGDGSRRVSVRAIVSTNGVILYLFGGDLPHIGGVAVGVPRPSSRDPNKTTANVSVISIVGHKDDELARPIADRVTRALNRISVVIAGIHVDNASQEDLQAVIVHAGEAVDDFLKAFGGQSETV